MDTHSQSELTTPSLQEMGRPSTTLFPAREQSSSNVYVTSDGTTTMANVPSDSDFGYNPVIQVPTTVDHQRVQYGGMVSVVQRSTTESKLLAALLAAKPNTLRQQSNGKELRNKTSLAHGMKRKPKKLEIRQAFPNGMSVSEYLEGERFEINHLANKMADYHVPVQLPSRKPVDVPQSIPAPNQTISNEIQPKLKSNSFSTSTNRYPVTGADGGSNAVYSPPPVIVNNNSYKKSFGPKKSWDYEMRKNLYPELASSENYENKSINPEIGAVSYKRSSDRFDLYSCKVEPELQKLDLKTPEEINELIRHHQSCSKLRCTNECLTLRDAYRHLIISNHKCCIWNAFYNVIVKHSSICFNTSCGVEFCLFVKHELHLTGVSVLRKHLLLKQRASLEEEFKSCEAEQRKNLLKECQSLEEEFERWEALGAHDGGLQCYHLPPPRLPVGSK